MKNKAMKQRVLLTALLTLIISGAAAQNSQVLYFMNLPQNHLLNPALRPTNTVYVGLPALTGININVKNNFLNFSDILSEGMKIDESSFPFLNADFDADRFIGRLRDLNYLEPTASIQVLGLGFSAGQNKDLYIFLDVTEHVNASMVFPRDLMKLAFLGNEDLAGQTFDLSDTKAELSYYREIGIGASKNINTKLRFGARARLLFGIATASFHNNAMNLTVNEDGTNTLDANMALDISGPVHFFLDSENHIENAEFADEQFDSSKGVINFLTNTRNAGFGLDLGAEYAVNDRITLSAAITDVGFIKWKSDLSNLEAYGNVELSGIDFQDVRENSATFDDVTNRLIDSLKNAFIFTNVEKPFTTKLPVGFTIGGKYDLNDIFSIGLLSYSRITGQQVKEALTVSANMNLANSLYTTLAYTACNNSYNNLGLGLGFRASVFQLYFLFDKIPLSWKKAGTADESVTLPANWNTMHARFGMNLVFGNRQGRRM